MRPLNHFHVEVESAGLGVWTDGGVAAVGEGAGLPVAEAGDIVLVSAEVLLFWGSLVRLGWEILSRGVRSGDILQLKAVEKFGVSTFQRGKKSSEETYLQNCWFITCQTISSEAIALTSLVVKVYCCRRSKVDRNLECILEFQSEGDAASFRSSHFGPVPKTQSLVDLECFVPCDDDTHGNVEYPQQRHEEWLFPPATGCTWTQLSNTATTTPSVSIFITTTICLDPTFQDTGDEK